MLATLGHPTCTFAAAKKLTARQDGSPTIEETGIIRTVCNLTVGAELPPVAPRRAVGLQPRDRRQQVVRMGGRVDLFPDACDHALTVQEDCGP